jgi:hypothetical protein
MFEKAVEIVEREMRNEEKVTLDGKGGASARMVAHIAVAKK